MQAKGRRELNGSRLYLSSFFLFFDLYFLDFKNIFVDRVNIIFPNFTEVAVAYIIDVDVNYCNVCQNYRWVSGESNYRSIFIALFQLMGIMDAPQLYSIIECCKLAINSMPDIYTNHEVQLGTRFGANTTYTITTEGLYTFGADTSIVLEDTKENIFIDLTIDSVYSFVGTIEDDTERFKLHFNSPMKPALKVYLSGAWNGLEMRTNLNSDGLLPLSQPYNDSPWNYEGTESVDESPNDDIVDWILVEMRDTTSAAFANASTIVEQQACFLLKNGSVVGLDGSSYPEFKKAIEQQIYITIYHRNHIPVMTAIAVTRQNGVYPYDFSSSASQAFGGTLAHKNMGGGVYGMYGGDGNADGNVNETDKISIWELIVGNKAYNAADYNLNGQSNNPDKNDIWNEDINHSSQVP